MPTASTTVQLPPLRTHLESLRRRTDASNMYFDQFPGKETRTPRPYIDRIMCRPENLDEVRRIVFEVNPWEGEIETSQTMPRGKVRVVWYDVKRVRQSGEFFLS